jgi:signal transduction histidine kinase
MRMRDVEDSWVNHLVKKICIPVTADAGSAVRALKERCSLLLRDTPECDPEDRKLMEILGVDAIAVAPLLIGERVLGVILADNVITHAPILDADVTLLEIFAREASAAIENARLYHDREVSVCQLEEAHRILRENQERMVYSERLVAMGEMAAAIAHEIRNPLASIGGFVRSILRNSPADDPNRRYMMLVSEEVDRLEKIVVDVLTFSHRPKPEMKEVDLNEVVRQTLLLIEAEIPRGKIAVTTELSPELPRLWLDPHQFRHVLLNVMQNAIHAMPDGGELYTATRREGRTVHLEVRDSGMGIAEQHLDKIFTPFYSTKSKGFGLGLAVTQRIIEDHRGFIEVKSEEGKGTTFLISLPLEKRDGMREHVANSADS